MSSGASSGTAASTGTTGGSSTGAVPTTGGIGTAGRPPDFIDGGYVFCTAELATDAGLSEWMCPPGTYFCQSPGNCAQCLSDSDCANPMLPTYEPSRPRCDLDSGVTGYQSFCQQCLVDSDCAGNAIDNQCDLNPSSVEPSIDAIGFETCALLGPGCVDGTQPGLGGCVSPSCTTDSDCVAAVSGSNQLLSTGFVGQQVEPFCVDGGCTSSPDDSALCPNCYCRSDVSCPDPHLTCDLLNDHCACTDSSQCGGGWPICELFDGGDVDDAGALLGSCGCRRDEDCGDAGLRCLYLAPNDTIYGGPACLVDCNDSRFPGCADLTPTSPICDVDSGLCASCQTDQDCQTHATGLSVGPLCRDDGICGCQTDSECPDGEVCGGPVSPGGAGGLLGQCIPRPLRCTPGSCSASLFCDLDGGTCEPTAGARVCASSADCAYVSGGAFCELDAGACVQCQEGTDCVAIGYAAQGYSRCLAGMCSATCASDQDCVGNSSGPHCGSSGRCSCLDASDCLPGQSCQPMGNVTGCSSACQSDSDCPTAFFCSDVDVCRPRCDDGGGGCQAPDLACDHDNLGQGNGFGSLGAVPGAVWCYQCLTGDDCGPGASCYFTSCSDFYCNGMDSCHAGETCGPVDGVCHASCDPGACPSGQVCDVGDSIGNGSDLCYQCLSALDCPGGDCNIRTHTCGNCVGPTSLGGLDECPPDAICSNYWPTSHGPGTGVCLQSCDVFACTNPSDICTVFPALTPDHKYCFGCLQDADCADAGPGARCDNSLGLTFTCKAPGAP